MFGFVLVCFLSLVRANDVIPDCTRTATVVAGDTCDKISTRYGVSTFQLALVNTPEINENCDNLMPDQVVCLGVADEDCTKVYTVVEGDTCDWIQEMYGMDANTLWSNNPQINAECTNIYTGEVLCVDTDCFDYPEFNQTAFDVVAETYVPFCDEI
ncbi:hypothetical protein CcaverHIS002_0306440 [Cutaneotrichosporon cavernicola]|uniref:LysM domain-containing protein n=1 Tax=Cutaneotrichosporon cavernicola TaxID=279322 RepID=A0AA48IGX7_9TREE|nr:uncharacterized protein CcaverHIS019_0306380 [Cutaneotrichosporon cavernicola]BEI82776.1 hypothetical protein CcaverHIS002_0306440 [Cutaneotrichosporon cavernicola]BEI90568.1 hypothetical protein CcaverHIS019_0306380 [Cutaneotrichosporon cavernicola]BEI98343.1 hypothetical protein CcaverHIS631_0306420 [Cutaneotrichosporon cavernicola]BEJ06118.1 hypothetical protein CcaverHIS641_0306400 [Cutaneotrichosporon cavernicola]